MEELHLILLIGNFLPLASRTGASALWENYLVL